jgi:C4-dicarboxylate-specific signal transduction histidine kinase
MSEGFSLLGRLGQDLDDEGPQARVGACLDQLRTLERLQRGLPARLEIVALDERLMVRLPEGVLVHVLLTLVTNAKEAAGNRPNGVVTLTVAPDESGDRLIVTIADNGVGFGDTPPEPEPFRSSRAARDHGGIGLAAAATLLLRYGGSLEMKNGMSGGAVARVIVPGS